MMPYKQMTVDDYEQNIVKAFQEKIQLPIGPSIRLLIRALAESQVEDEKRIVAYINALIPKNGVKLVPKTTRCICHRSEQDPVDCTGICRGCGRIR